MKRRIARRSPTLGQLTSLDLIRGFVAVGRRMSITGAAEDLCLTQSAVSRQVRAMEQMLGVKLLVRGHRSIAFTAHGEQLFRCADGAIKQLQDVIGAIRFGAATRPVTITASIGVAGLWLLPRLGRFLEQHPHIDVRIAANNKLNDLRNDGADLAIRYCAPDAAPSQGTHLFGETVAPVAHPSLDLLVVRSREELEALNLLEFDAEYRPWLKWSEWLASQGWEDLRPKAVLRFNQYDQAIQAAMAGQGVALGRIELIRDALADGRLARVEMPRSGPATTHGYWLMRSTAATRPEVEEVACWIMEEAEAATAHEPAENHVLQ
jgi:LysR family transcriptional regulator, glycine cleavage system transcriptional activator